MTLTAEKKNKEDGAVGEGLSCEARLFVKVISILGITTTITAGNRGNRGGQLGRSQGSSPLRRAASRFS